MDLGRTRFKALKSFLARLVEFIVHQEFLGSSSLLGDGFLTVHEVDLEALGVFDAENVPASWSVFHFLDAVVENFGAGNLGDSRGRINKGSRL